MFPPSMRAVHPLSYTYPMIVFFDGECGLCDRVVRWLMRLDTRGQLQFAPLQGETARERLTPELVRDLSTLVAWSDGVSWTHSDALRQILAVLGRPIWLRLTLAATPRALRDAIYRWIAANRHRWWGARSHCEPLSTEARARMLP